MRFAINLFCGAIISLFYFNGSILCAFSTFELKTYAPVGFEAEIDPAGYSDWILWGQSDYHPHGLHELLSGEWGAAIYYDGNPKEPNAMWLTNEFKFPDWPTYCNFNVVSSQVWQDPCNPVVGVDKAKSIISNNEVEITIDYEIADLGANHFSPLVYQEPGSIQLVARSERYVLLQTYTIKNIKESGDINGLEFYQMLHGHGADDYGPVVHCNYQSTLYPDALSNYTPYNPVHQVGNFRYDITQWNDLAEEGDHIDWVGFSSTVEPNVYECNYYEGHYEEPPSGTHKDIEQRNLDNSNYSYGETAGAMGWFLPTLEPNQTTSITVAFMFGTTDWPCPSILTKNDNIPDGNCVLPGDYITYTIDYDANGLADNNVAIIDYLPDEVDYNLSSPDGNYNPDTRTVIWNLGTVTEDYNETFTLIVKVNNLAEPCGVIINRCEVVGDIT